MWNVAREPQHVSRREGAKIARAPLRHISIHQVREKQRLQRRTYSIARGAQRVALSRPALLALHSSQLLHMLRYTCFTLRAVLHAMQSTRCFPRAALDT